MTLFLHKKRGQLRLYCPCFSVKRGLFGLKSPCFITNRALFQCLKSPCFTMKRGQNFKSQNYDGFWWHWHYWVITKTIINNGVSPQSSCYKQWGIPQSSCYKQWGIPQASCYKQWGIRGLYNRQNPFSSYDFRPDIVETSNYKIELGK